MLGVPTLCRYDLLRRMVRSVRKGTVPADYVVVIDNGGGLELKRKHQRDWHVVRPERNLGVAASWNELVRIRERDHPEAELVIANDDAVFTRRGIERMLARPEPVVGSRGSGFFAGFLWRLGPEWQFDELFYPAYHEDVDMAVRLARAGVAHGEVEGAVHHAGGASTTAEERKPMLARNLERFRAKWGDEPMGDWWLPPEESPYYREPWNGLKPP